MYFNMHPFIITDGTISFPASGRSNLLNAVLCLFGSTTFLLFCLVYHHYLTAIILAIAAAFYVNVHYVRPARATMLNLCSTENGLLIDNKLLPWDKVLFLSFRQAEGCTMLRLELVRRNILFANEHVLYAGCRSYEHALELGKFVKQHLGNTIPLVYMAADTSNKLSVHKSRNYGRDNEALREEWIVVG
jgi:hypothetical protein